MKQQSENACGTVGIFHAIFNNLHRDPELLIEGGYLKQFYADTTKLDADGIAQHMKQAEELKQMHQEAAGQGVTQAQRISNAHFVSYIEKNGHIYKMDGLEESPVYQGDLAEGEDFLAATCKIARKVMEADPEQIHFSLMVLAYNDFEFA